MTLEKVFSAFLVQSNEEAARLHALGQLTERETRLLLVVFENATATLSSIVEAYKMTKSINEADFEWMMKLYAYVGLQELYTILDHVRIGVDPRIVATVDVSTDVLLSHFNEIIRGEGILEYQKLAWDMFNLREKEAASYEALLAEKYKSVQHLLVDAGVLVSNNEVDISELSENLENQSLIGVTKLVAA